MVREYDRDGTYAWATACLPLEIRESAVSIAFEAAD
jgi:hypothetical protein